MIFFQLVYSCFSCPMWHIVVSCFVCLFYSRSFNYSYRNTAFSWLTSDSLTLSMLCGLNELPISQKILFMGILFSWNRSHDWEGQIKIKCIFFIKCLSERRVSCSKNQSKANQKKQQTNRYSNPIRIRLIASHFQFFYFDYLFQMPLATITRLFYAWSRLLLLPVFGLRCAVFNI